MGVHNGLHEQSSGSWWRVKDIEMSEYSDDVTNEAETHHTLGAEYFEARDKVREFLEHWNEDHAQKLSDEIVKPLLDTIHERVNDAFRDFLLADAEDNLQGTMRNMVESTVNALIGGKRWANSKYIENPYGDGEAIRETLAKLHSDPIKDGRIADLEKQLARTQKDLEFYRSR
jgi:hypothetical protein